MVHVDFHKNQSEGSKVETEIRTYGREDRLRRQTSVCTKRKESYIERQSGREAHRQTDRISVISSDRVNLHGAAVC
jgi:hypothetical protein